VFNYIEITKKHVIKP